MAAINPAHDRHHTTEAYRSQLAALQRLARVSRAGYRAYVVDMARASKAGRQYVVHISEGKHHDLRALAARQRG
jgi:hypothetical protein